MRSKNYHIFQPTPFQSELNTGITGCCECVNCLHRVLFDGFFIEVWRTHLYESYLMDFRCAASTTRDNEL